jgi:hypothetical protein
MTLIECEVELRRTDGRVLSTSMSVQVRPVEDQPINVRVDGGEWVKAKITLVKPLNVSGTQSSSHRGGDRPLTWPASTTRSSQ